MSHVTIMILNRCGTESVLTFMCKVHIHRVLFSFDIQNFVNYGYPVVNNNKITYILKLSKHTQTDTQSQGGGYDRDQWPCRPW